MFLMIVCVAKLRQIAYLFMALLHRFDGPMFGVLFPDKKYGTKIHVSVATGALQVGQTISNLVEE
jgi:hypothetical protein